MGDLNAEAARYGVPVQAHAHCTAVRFPVCCFHPVKPEHKKHLEILTPRWPVTAFQFRRTLTVRRSGSQSAVSIPSNLTKKRDFNAEGPVTATKLKPTFSVRRSGSLSAVYFKKRDFNVERGKLRRPCSNALSLYSTS